MENKEAENPEAGFSYLNSLIGIMLIIAAGFCLVYFNGWDFIVLDYIMGQNIENGLYIGEIGNTSVAVILIDGDWYGMGNVHPETAVINSPFINMIGMGAGVGLIVQGIYSTIALIFR